MTTQTEPKPIADRLRKFRGKRFQEHAAKDLGVKLDTYRKWENGFRTPRGYAMLKLDEDLTKRGF